MTFRTRIKNITWKNIEKLCPIGSRVVFIPSKGNYAKLGTITGYSWQVHLDNFKPFFEPNISWDIKSIVFVDGPCNPLCLRLVKEKSYGSLNNKE